MMAKRIIMLLLATFFATIASAQLKFEIHGTINSALLPDSPYKIKEGDIIELDFINLERIDSAVVKDSTFHLIGEVPIPSVAMLNHENGGLLLLIDSSTYHVSIKGIKDERNRYYYGDKHVDTESFFYTLWKYFGNQKRYLGDKKEELQRLISESELQDERLEYERSLTEVNEELAALYYDKAKELPNSYEMTYLLPVAPDFSYDRYFWYYNELSEEVKNSFYGKNLYQRLTADKLNSAE